MDKKYLSDMLTQSDCEALDRELTGFGSGAELDDETSKRILSSVMRKAGFEMDNNITVSKKNKRMGRRFTVLLAAAVIAVTGAVGAGAAYVYRKNAANETYFGSGADSKLESMGAKSGLTFKGKRFDINIESVLSDGEYLTLVASAVPNDEEGAKQIANGEETYLHSKLAERGTYKDENGNEVTEYAEDIGFVYEGGAENMRWEYKLDTPQDKVTIPMTVVMGFNLPEDNIIAEFDITFEKNMHSVKLTNDKGEVMTLFDNGIKGCDVTIIPKTDPLPMREVTVEYTDGSSKSIEIFGFSPYDADAAEDGHYESLSVTFNDLIDTSSVKAVTIGKTRFEVGD